MFLPGSTHIYGPCTNHKQHRSLLMLLLMLLSDTGGSSSDSTGPQSSGLSRQQGTLLRTTSAPDSALMT